MKNKEITNEMPEVKRDAIPFYVYEALVASHERTRKLLITALIILSLAFAITNGYWIYEWTQYDTVDYSYSQDGEGTNIIGAGNEVNNGTETTHPYQDQAKR